MQRLAEARKYAHEYVRRKQAEVERFNEFTVETPEEAASVIMHLRLAHSAAKHEDMGAPAVRNLEAFNHIVRKAKEAVAKQTPESFMLQVPQTQASHPTLPTTPTASSSPLSPPLMSRDDLSIASDDSFGSEGTDGPKRAAGPPRLKSADPVIATQRVRRSKPVQRRKEEWDIRTSDSIDVGKQATAKYAVSVKPGQRVRVRALGRSYS